MAVISRALCLHRLASGSNIVCDGSSGTCWNILGPQRQQTLTIIRVVTIRTIAIVIMVSTMVAIMIFIIIAIVIVIIIIIILPIIITTIIITISVSQSIAVSLVIIIIIAIIGKVITDILSIRLPYTLNCMLLNPKPLDIS